VGMSGGVDSTLAAWLLKKQGHEVFAVTMSVWDPARGDFRGGCFGADEPEETARAARFARRLGIEHSVIDLRAEYGTAVVEYFKKEYLAGRTPNPCARCNRLLKLGLLLDRTRAACGGFDFFATGHYARVENGVLKTCADARKDQTYFLWAVPRERLAQLMFPLGGLTKNRVRDMAREAGFPEAAALPESQDFIGGDYCGLFNKEDNRPGPLLDLSGREIGRHGGIIRYTVGQRKGMKIGGLSKPLYVVAIDAARNAVIAGTKEEAFRKTIRAGGLNLLADVEWPVRADVKIRRQHEAAPALISAPENGVCRIDFDAPQFAPAPGQSAVFYSGETVLGGGIIS